ncbi:hypothetical protein PUN28_013153 [Cardiocondyla obscurior]|uniref:Ribosomal protein S14 n=1 Tax=Cardiocondyla obscurior TaxID=286306 RepID=A0AAW2FAI9_9HYME
MPFSEDDEKAIDSRKAKLLRNSPRNQFLRIESLLSRSVTAVLIIRFHISILLNITPCLEQIKKKKKKKKRKEKFTPRRYQSRAPTGRAEGFCAGHPRTPHAARIPIIGLTSRHLINKRDERSPRGRTLGFVASLFVYPPAQ